MRLVDVVLLFVMFILTAALGYFFAWAWYAVDPWATRLAERSVRRKYGIDKEGREVSTAVFACCEHCLLHFGVCADVETGGHRQGCDECRNGGRRDQT